jgi:hypothetical protein
MRTKASVLPFPAAWRKAVYERLKASGRVARGWLGVQLDDVSEQTALRLGLPAASGALIVTVVDDLSLPSPAKDAGLRVGDVVVSWNGIPVSKSADLIRMVAMTQIGSAARSSYSPRPEADAGSAGRGTAGAVGRRHAGGGRLRPCADPYQRPGAKGGHQGETGCGPTAVSACARRPRRPESATS